MSPILQLISYTENMRDITGIHEDKKSISNQPTKPTKPTNQPTNQTNQPNQTNHPKNERTNQPTNKPTHSMQQHTS
jgi:hypothetical protein